MSELSISFVLLTYNQQDTVREAVESVLAQEGPNLEIVISDDCSTDNTFELIKSTVKDYIGPHKIILNRNNTNLGIAGNLNKVHQLSSGDYLICGAGDDISYPHRSKLICNAFTTSNPLLVCSYVNLIDQEGTPLPYNFDHILFHKHNWDVNQAAKSLFLYIGATGAWHRSLYERYGPFESIAEDLILGFRAALENRVTVINERLIKWRTGGVSSIEQNYENFSLFLNSQREFCVWAQAVFTQRIRDARNYGLDSKSTVLKLLQLEKDNIDSKIKLYEKNYSLLYRNIWLRIKYLNRKRLRRRRSKK